MRLRYDGPGHVLAAFGKTVRRGDVATFADNEARSLLANRHIRVTADPAELARARAEAERPSRHGSRRQWAAYAESKGVAVTDEMTRDEIRAATDVQPSGTDAPEAHQGEGHHTTEEQETP